MMTQRDQRKGEKLLPVPTLGEARAITLALSSQANRPARAKLSIERKPDKAVVVSNPHNDQSGWLATVQKTFGSSSEEFVNDCVVKLLKTFEHCYGVGDQEGINAGLALIAGIAPEDEFQAAIAVQVATTHAASIHLTARALHNSNTGHVEAAAVLVGMATKLSRTMVAHVEALAKLRGGGRQIVEHRYIQVNGNAVVGDQTQAIFGDANPQGGKSESERQAHGSTGGTGECPSLPGPQSPREALPAGGGAWTEEVPQPRREGHRRAHGPSKRKLSPRPAD